MQKDFKYFKEKENALNLALNRVRVLLESYKTNPPAGDIWNLTHDLEHRIEARLKDNFSDFCGWRWDNFGFNIY